MVSVTRLVRPVQEWTREDLQQAARQEAEQRGSVIAIPAFARDRYPMLEQLRGRLLGKRPI